MTTEYLFNADGLCSLARHVATDCLFAFDLDGTFAPIVEHASAARIVEPIRVTLERLERLARTVVITGRSRKDALAVLGFEPQLLIGNHGAEWPPEHAGRNWEQVRLCLKWQEKLFDRLGYMQGVEIEFKGESISIHYRRAEDPVKAVELISSAVKSLSPEPQSFGGKFVVNLLPPDATTKGCSLLAVMKMYGLEKAMYFGDDVTDKDVFRLKGDIDLFGVHIGGDVPTAASYYLKNQAELLGLLNSIVGMLEVRSAEGTPQKVT